MRSKLYDQNLTAEDLLHFLEFGGEHKIKFQWISKSTYGMVLEDETIIFNIVLLLLQTYVHEYLHVIDDAEKHLTSEEERQIDLKAARAIDRMSCAEIRKISRVLMKIFELQMTTNEANHIFPRIPKKKKASKKAKKQ